ncbi:GNAT family N-acetyltransferase [Streptococcus sp. S784/96/1]|uniref:GNAT family N-acetyltransferase n=1 Tax=Streptococcus sp. S784/96/1 TaxID=2653499 RepID=UPI0013866B0D|nr:GNAT family N-acetyltransferase [Streptococcus sp. S784/96/1]
MLIRYVTSEDWAAICKIEADNFPKQEAATPNDLRRRINQLRDTFLVVEISGCVAGYIVGQAVFQRYLSDNLFHEVEKNTNQGGFIIVTSLAVAKESQGQGIGTALLAALKDVAVSQKRQGISLTCHDYLITYYEANGFVDEGESASVHGGAFWYNLVWENPYLDKL